MSGAVVRVEGVGRRFGRRWALRGVDLELERGEIVALAGPNGSGKTTLLRLLAGFGRATEGSVAVFGVDPWRERAAVMRRARFAFAPPALLDGITAREHLVRLGGLHAGAAARDGVDALLERVGLSGRADEPVRVFSFGMRQRLAIAQALCPKPELLVLDEPAEGLDPLGVRELRGLVGRLRDDGVAILIASHLLHEVERVADRVLVLHEGRELLRGTPGELTRQHDSLEDALVERLLASGAERGRRA